MDVLQCVHCNTDLSSQQMLSHMRDCHSDLPFKVYRYTKGGRLPAPILNGPGQLEIVCEHPKTTSMDDWAIVTHKFTLLSKNQTFICRFCGYESASFSQLEAHVYPRHFNLVPFACGLCGKGASQMDIGLFHLLANHQGKALQLLYRKPPDLSADDIGSVLLGNDVDKSNLLTAFQHDLLTSVTSTTPGTSMTSTHQEVRSSRSSTASTETGPKESKDPGSTPKTTGFQQNLQRYSFGGKDWGCPIKKKAPHMFFCNTCSFSDRCLVYIYNHVAAEHLSYGRWRCNECDAIGLLKNLCNHSTDCSAKDLEYCSDETQEKLLQSGFTVKEPGAAEKVSCKAPIEKAQPKAHASMSAPVSSAETIDVKEEEEAVVQPINLYEYTFAGKAIVVPAKERAKHTLMCKECSFNTFYTMSIYNHVARNHLNYGRFTCVNCQKFSLRQSDLTRSCSCGNRNRAIINTADQGKEDALARSFIVKEPESSSDEDFAQQSSDHSAASNKSENEDERKNDKSFHKKETSHSKKGGKVQKNKDKSMSKTKGKDSKTKDHSKGDVAKVTDDGGNSSTKDKSVTAIDGENSMTFKLPNGETTTVSLLVESTYTFKCTKCDFTTCFPLGILEHVGVQHLHYGRLTCTFCRKLFFHKPDFIKHRDSAKERGHNLAPFINTENRKQETLLFEAFIAASVSEPKQSVPKKNTAKRSKPFASKRRISSSAESDEPLTKRIKPSSSFGKKSKSNRKVQTIVDSDEELGVIKDEIKMERPDFIQVLDEFELQGKLVKIARGHSYEFSCNSCKLQSPDLAMMYGHVATKHMQYGRWTCSQCGKLYFTNNQLTRHIKTHCPKGTKINNVSTEKERKLQKGFTVTKAPEGRLQFECKKCDVKTFKRTKMLIHVAAHLGVKQFICSVCKGFLTPLSFVKHQEIRCASAILEPVLEDSTMDLDSQYITQFVVVQGLKNEPMDEEQDHTTEAMETPTAKASKVKPKSKSTAKNTVVQAVRKRSREPSTFRCKSCGKIGHKRDSLLAHAALQHVGYYRFKCSVCSRPAYYRHFLTNHINSHTPETGAHIIEDNDSSKNESVISLIEAVDRSGTPSPSLDTSSVVYTDVDVPSTPQPGANQFEESPTRLPPPIELVTMTSIADQSSKSPPSLSVQKALMVMKSEKSGAKFKKPNTDDMETDEEVNAEDSSDGISTNGTAASNTPKVMPLEKSSSPALVQVGVSGTQTLDTNTFVASPHGRLVSILPALPSGVKPAQSPSAISPAVEPPIGELSTESNNDAPSVKGTPCTPAPPVSSAGKNTPVSLKRPSSSTGMPHSAKSTPPNPNSFGGGNSNVKPSDKGTPKSGNIMPGPPKAAQYKAPSAQLTKLIATQALSALGNGQSESLANSLNNIAGIPGSSTPPLSGNTPSGSSSNLGITPGTPPRFAGLVAGSSADPGITPTTSPQHQTPLQPMESLMSSPLFRPFTATTNQQAEPTNTTMPQQFVNRNDPRDTTSSEDLHKEM